MHFEADDYPGILYQVIWTKYLHMMSNIMPYVPYMVLPGNHEVSFSFNILIFLERTKVASIQGI